MERDFSVMDTIDVVNKIIGSKFLQNIRLYIDNYAISNP